MSEQPNTPNKEADRVRFGTGETDVMPREMAEYVLMRLYGESNASRKKFAAYMREYWIQRS
jgi:hypothetical protein